MLVPNLHKCDNHHYNDAQQEFQKDFVEVILFILVFELENFHNLSWFKGDLSPRRYGDLTYFTKKKTTLHIL